MSHPSQGGSPKSRALHALYRVSAALVLTLVLSLLLTSCDLFRRPVTVTPGEPSPTAGTPIVAPQVTSTPGATVAGGQAPATGRPQGRQPGLAAGEEVRGMVFYLSEGSTTPPAEKRAPVAQGQPLGAAEVEKLLQRMPPLDGLAGDVQAFRLPPESPPPPRPGQTITQTFPPPEPGPTPEAIPTGPLKVLRYSPEGDVPLAPYLSVTFDQPMVPLATIEQLAARDVPVKLSPMPEGQWRWVGTKTLMFEPAGRFPMATEYRVEIPAGTTSETGGKLAETVTWVFRTPPPQVQASYPNQGVFGRDPLLFVSFDQRVDPAAVLETVTLRAAGKTFALRLATEEEVRGNEAVSRLAKETAEGRWLAFRTTETLPYDAQVQVDIGPGTPSAEGPLKTTAAQSFAFSTYGPLRVVNHRCGWDNNCPPMAPWAVEFSNALDQEAFDPSLVVIEPELPGAEIAAFGNIIQIRGQSRGRTTYKVTLKAGIRDQFGQTLERDETVTFSVGSAEPVMVTPWQPLVVLDPSAQPQYTVYTVNYDTLRVQAYAVQPEDWPAYERFLRETPAQRNAGTPPGRRVLNTTVRTKGERDSLAETAIDLKPLLQSGRGHLILIINPEVGPLASKQARDVSVIRTWVEATGISLDAFIDQEEMLVWTNALQDGSTLSGVEVTLFPGNTRAQTDNEGMARLALGTSQQEEGHYLAARSGDDTAILPSQAYGWGGGWMRRPLSNTYRWYVFDDRQMYRPEEEVHVKGWVRLAELQRGRESLSLPGQGLRVHYELQDAQGNSVVSGDVDVNALGGFHTAFTLPAAINLGPATLRLQLQNIAANTEGYEYGHQIQVQQFRRPEFEVSTSANEGPHFVGDYAITSVEAKYYAGGPLPNAEVTWQVTSQPGSYRPPKWDEFAFGIWTPWWAGSGGPKRRGGVWIEGGPDSEPAEVKSYSGRTDASGAHHLRIDFEAMNPPRPMSIQAQATVMDVNRQAWTSSTQLLVHPAELYVGLRGGTMFVEKGKPLLVDAVVTNLDGQAIAGRSVDIRAVRLVWTYVRGEWQEQERDEQLCTVISAQEAQRCTFQTPEGGTYRITATVYDDLERPNVTQITRWVGGGQWPRANRVEQEKVQLIPDRQEYQPGETAEILVQAPFAPAEGLLTLRINGVARSERFRMDQSSTVLRVPIDEDHIPNVNVQVDLVGSAPRLNDAGEPENRVPQRPAYAVGSLDLQVPPYLRQLGLEVIPRDTELQPGSETTVDVRVKDATGQAVAGAELAVAVVDESILALTGYELADPLAAFYPSRSGGVSDQHLREQVLLVDPSTLLDQAVAAPKMAASAAQPMATMAVQREMAAADMGGRGGGPESQPIRVRSDFNPLAAFEPAVPTDADGTASVTIKLPDNLTRYRVMVVAVSDDRFFGKGDASITARLPLMVRPSPPRFLNFGDRFELPVVVQNQTDDPLEAEVALRTTNLELIAGAGQKVTVPPRDRVEVRFPATTVSAGISRLQVAASAGEWADAAQLEFPVYTPATTEAFAVYGTVDEGAIAQPIIAPTDVYTQFGGLEISTSSTALQALTDAVLYLTTYPYECSEQIASRVLAIAALRDVLSAFNAAGLPSPEELEQVVQRDIEKLGTLQNDDGGFPVWWRGNESWPFHSIHVAHALARAQQKDYAVPEDMIARALDYLSEIEALYPEWYDQDMRNTLTAYALSVRAQLGDPDPARARQLVQEAGVEGLKMEALGWLLPILADDAGSSEQVDQIRRFLANRVSETAGAANFVTSYREEDAYVLLSSNRRADGILLEALIDTDPKNDLIPKLVRGLLAHRNKGRWGNTQENVFILLALDRYFQEYEAQTPDFVARAWLGEQYVGSAEFQGRSADYRVIQLPMSYLAQVPDEQNLVLDKQGQGRLYYRLGLRYAPTNLTLEPLDQGFTVERVYEAADDPADVRRDDNGVWHVRAGARLRVRLRMVVPSRRYHVALVDPLPAGLEIMNPALAVTGNLPRDPSGSGVPRYWWWQWTWYEHQNLRDERAEAFASLVWDGIYTYTYVARATTPGQFVVPPARAEEMYSPEVFGRSGTDRVVVE